MIAWAIRKDLMRANEEQTVRAARYAPHRAHLYRRHGRLVASLFRSWSRIAPRHGTTLPPSLPRTTQDPMNLGVVRLDD